MRDFAGILVAFLVIALLADDRCGCVLHCGDDGCELHVAPSTDGGAR